MKDVKVAGIDFDSAATNHDPHIIGVFGDEHCGKTRLALTGPSGIGCVVTEMKSYLTITKDSTEYGKRVLKPTDPMALIASNRKLNAMKSATEQQKYYIELVKRIENVTYALLENPEVRIVMIDKFTAYCHYKEFAVNGMEPNYIKIDGAVRQRKAEVIQGIVDFVNALSEYGKPVMLLCSTRPDFDYLDKDGHPLRNTWNCGSFYYLGSHTNLTVELIDNKFWRPDSKKADERWHYRLNVRRCQKRPELEGPEGSPLLEDDGITLTNLITMIEPDVDVEAWM